MLGRLREVIVDQGGAARALAKAARSPGRAGRFLFRILERDWIQLLFGSHGNWRKMRDELDQCGYLAERTRLLRDRFDALRNVTVRDHPVTPGHVSSLHARLLYALVRHNRPEVVVETGVCNGLSSAVILHAMERNRVGRLYSIDLPEFTDPAMNDVTFWNGKKGAAVPAGLSPGWLVPPELSHRWQMRIGRSQEILQLLLDEVGPVDIFIHDSEHSYENQMLEFTKGYEALAPGGVLLCTDIGWSDAYDDFLAGLRPPRPRSALIDANCAAVVKPG